MQILPSSRYWHRQKKRKGDDSVYELIVLHIAQNTLPGHGQAQCKPPRSAFPDKLHISRSLKRSIRPGLFSVTVDQCFREVMRHCAGPRPQYPDGGTWITADMLAAYTLLHKLGYAHSVETWKDGQLVDGLYGVALGGVFFAESMFTRVADRSEERRV